MGVERAGARVVDGGVGRAEVAVGVSTAVMMGEIGATVLSQCRKGREIPTDVSFSAQLHPVSACMGCTVLVGAMHGRRRQWIEDDKQVEWWVGEE